MNGLSEKDQWTMNILKVKPYVDFKNLQQEKDFSRQLKRAKPDNLLSKFFNIILKLTDNKPVINHDSQEIKDLKRENTLLQKQNLEYKLELETYKNTRRANKLLSEKNEELKDEIIELNKKIKMLQGKDKVNNDPSVFDEDYEKKIVETPKIVSTPKVIYDTPIRYDNSTDYFYKLDDEEKQLDDYTDEEIYHTMKSLELTKEQWDKTSDIHKKTFLLYYSLPVNERIDNNGKIKKKKKQQN